MMQLCPWEDALYFVYSSNVPTLFFYSHIPAIVVALLTGFLIFYKSEKSKIGTTLLIISLLFSIWSFVDLILWSTNRPDVVMFFWSMQILIEPLIYLLGFYMTYVFIKNVDLSFKAKILLVLLYSPVVVLLSSQYNLSGVDLAYCTAVEGFVAQYFTYIIESIFIFAIISLVIFESIKNPIVIRKREILIFALGVILFLIAFSSGNIIGSFTNNWNLAQIGLIGMPIFIVFLAYLIVKFHTFNVKLFATQVLVWGSAILIGSQLFFVKTPINMILTSFTFIAMIIGGTLLIKSVKKEIQQKEELYQLNIELAYSIQQRESLVHLVTHKVKSSFTRTKYIFAGIIDGTFGNVSDEVKKIASQGLESDNMGIETVDLVLNAANLQKGGVKYDMKNIDFKELVFKSIEDKKISAEKKGLEIGTDIKEGEYHIWGDTFWLKEALNNLIENSVKYTKEGKIMIGLEKKNNKILFSVKDNGIGLTSEDKKVLFTEGGRGKDSVKVNVDSTGYGLYTVRLVVDSHKGRVWAESEGPGKGSQFYIELDAA